MSAPPIPKTLGSEVQPAPGLPPQSRPPARKATRSKWWLYVIYVTLAVAAVWSYRQVSIRPVEVQTATARLEDLKSSFTAEGSVKGKEYNLAPEATGRVTSIFVKEGDFVHKGQPLLDLDPSEALPQTDQILAGQMAASAQMRQAIAALDLSRAQSSARVSSARALLRQALARLNQVLSGARPQEIARAQHTVERMQSDAEDAERAYNRTKMLYEGKAVARADLEAAENRLHTSKAALSESKDALALLEAGSRSEEKAAAQSAVDAAKADLQLAQTGQREIRVREEAVSAARAQLQESDAAVRRSQAGLRKLRLLAPADAYVTHVRLETGALAQPGAPVVTLASRADMHIEAEISSEDAAKVKPGLEVTVTSPAYPGSTFPAKVVSLSAVGELKPDAAIRTRIVRARVELIRDQEHFRPGIEVDVEGNPLVKKTLTVPSDALTFDGSKTVVFTVVEGVVHENVVTTGFSSAQQTEILSGLKAGQAVIVVGKDNLKENQKVHVRQ